jgi:hypothetical protein
MSTETTSRRPYRRRPSFAGVLGVALVFGLVVAPQGSGTAPSAGNALTGSGSLNAVLPEWSRTVLLRSYVTDGGRQMVNADLPQVTMYYRPLSLSP